MKSLTASSYARLVHRLTPQCQEIILRYQIEREPTDPSIISPVVLTCKREAPLQRLIASGPEKLWERTTILDNGSYYSEELRDKFTEFFRVIRHKINIGIAGALNSFLATSTSDFILLIEDDLVMTNPSYHNLDWLQQCVSIFRENPHVGIIKLKEKPLWDQKPTRVVGPIQRTSKGALWYPWLPSNPWNVRIGNRPWHAGIHNVWSLGPVMFRWAAWAENGPLPVAQGRGQAVAAEDWYARTFNAKWIAARPVTIHPFMQPTTEQSPGYDDEV